MRVNFPGRPGRGILRVEELSKGEVMAAEGLGKLVELALDLVVARSTFPVLADSFQIDYIHVERLVESVPLH
jgi:hypothetical protein